MILLATALVAEYSSTTRIELTCLPNLEPQAPGPGVRSLGLVAALHRPRWQIVAVLQLGPKFVVISTKSKSKF